MKKVLANPVKRTKFSGDKKEDGLIDLAGINQKPSNIRLERGREVGSTLRPVFRYRRTKPPRPSEKFWGQLNPKQRRFVEEYLVDCNATQAAIRAGYSAKGNPYAQGHILLKNPKVAAAIDDARKKLTQRVGISQERVLQEYAKIAFADIKDFLTFRTEKVLVGYTKKGKPIFEYRQIIKMKPSEEVDGTVIQEVSLTDKGTFSFKLHDKKAALEKIGQHFGMFVHRIEGEVNATHDHVVHVEQKYHIIQEIINRADEEKREKLAEFWRSRFSESSS